MRIFSELFVMKTLVKEQLTSHTGEEGMILCRKHLKMYSHCKKKEHMNLDFYQPIVIKINVFALNSCELKKKGYFLSYHTKMHGFRFLSTSVTLF